jgi:hypothetical protein
LTYLFEILDFAELYAHVAGYFNIVNIEFMSNDAIFLPQNFNTVENVQKYTQFGLERNSSVIVFQKIS